MEKCWVVWIGFYSSISYPLSWSNHFVRIVWVSDWIPYSPEMLHLCVNCEFVIHVLKRLGCLGMRGRFCGRARKNSSCYWDWDKWCNCWHVCNDRPLPPYRFNGETFKKVFLVFGCLIIQLLLAEWRAFGWGWRRRRWWWRWRRRWSWRYVSTFESNAYLFNIDLYTVHFPLHLQSLSF